MAYRSTSLRCFASLGLALLSGCGGARVVTMADLTGQPMSHPISETGDSGFVPEETEASVPAPVDSAPEGGPAPEPTEDPPIADGSAGESTPVADAPDEEAIADEDRDPASVDDEIVFEDHPEDSVDGPVEFAIDAPYDVKVRYRYDGDDPVEAGLSFDLGKIEAGDHVLVVEILFPDGRTKTYEFRWTQLEKFDPDALTTDEIAKKKKNQRAKKEKRKKEREARKLTKKREREEKRKKREEAKKEKKDKKDRDRDGSSGKGSGKNDAEDPDRGNPGKDAGKDSGKSSEKGKKDKS